MKIISLFFIRKLVFPFFSFGVPTIGLFFSENNFISPSLLGFFLVVVTSLSILFLEKKYPFHSKWNNDHDDKVTDIYHVIGHIISFKGIQVALIIFLSKYFNINALSKFLGHNFQGSLIFEFLVIYLLIEFLHYFFHRLVHQNSKLWKFHEIHHYSKRLYSLNGLKSHVFDVTLRLVVPSLVIIFLGASSKVIIFYSIHSMILSLLQHANIDMDLKYWNLIFSTPDLHRFHHSRSILKSSTNYGKSLIIYDIIFKTYYNNNISNVDDIGIEKDEVPIGYLSQLLYPFRKPIK